jgi:hypothetical protein
LKLILLRLEDTANTGWSFKLPRLSFLTLLLFLPYHRFGSYNGDKKRSLKFEGQAFSVPLTAILLKKESSREWEQRSQRSQNYSSLSPPVAGVFQGSYFLNSTA